MRRLPAVLLLLTATPASAHDLGQVWSVGGAWSYDPWLVIPLYLAAILYLLGTRRLWRRAGHGRGVHPWHAACFWAGWTLLALALISPLHWIAERVLAVHMIEHEIIMVAAAPLLVLSRPLVALLFAVPLGWRRGLGAITSAAPFRGLWRLLSAPFSATLLHGSVIWSWHMPLLFDAAVANPFLHKLQHASFLAVALLFWWANCKLERRDYGIAALHLFATMMAMSLLGALLTLSPRLWYSAYAASDGLSGLTPLEDQQLAGLVMWIPGCMVYAVAALAFFGLWLTKRPVQPISSPLASVRI